MAKLIRESGQIIDIQPLNGVSFKLEEAQKYVNGLVEVIDLGNGKIFLINEDGKFLCERNNEATKIALKRGAIFHWDYIAGDVVLCKDEEFR